ncbi:uncharacterized protein LOC109847533 [Asparagus officinalis]|uniref:uncharacterized protein LOC109847533 n=1 Tax=Asparagus officinalis TaxID=4686 RepID=UPI00098E8203|nr:uncharacterized protein LOC109847533 [Asparagus officinalis]
MIHQCFSRKIEACIIKIDFCKAFDCVSWDFLISLLNARGFGSKWLSWIKFIMFSSSSSMLVNGTPTNPFTCHRGLKQGDPLSLMLFLLVADVLCRMLHNSCNYGDLLELHLKCMLNDIKSLQFADDTLIFCKATSSDISNLKSILYLFEEVSGLATNFSKSNLYYSSKSSPKGLLLANILNCSFASPPFKYLGLLLRRGSLSRADWQPLLDSLNHKLSQWKSKHLPIGGRLVLLKSVLSSVSFYYISFFKLPSWLIKNIDKIRRNFLWGGSADHNAGNHPVRWGTICSPKVCGGLGVLNHLFNISLLSK